MSVLEYLNVHGVDVDEEELTSALDQLLGENLISEGSAGLTKDAATVLERIAPRPRRRAVSEATAATVAESIALVSGSRSVEQVASDLGIDPSRIRHRVADKALYALRVGRRLSLPTWQFDEGAPLPSLGAVLAALAPDLHPLEVAGFMTSPHPELEVRGRTVSPKRWLSGGGDPAPIIELAESLAVSA